MTARLVVIRECTDCPDGSQGSVSAEDSCEHPKHGGPFGDGKRLPWSAMNGSRRRIPAWCPLPKAKQRRRK